MKKSRVMKYICITLALSLVLQLFTSFSVSAATPYQNYFIAGADEYSMVLPTPEAYENTFVVDFPDTASGKLNSPEDIFLGPDGKLYVSDTGNNRIVVLEKNAETGKFVFDMEITGQEVGKPLSEPKSVFVDDDGTILVCDFGNMRLVEFTKEGKFRYEYDTPSSDILGEDFKYQPVRVIKDDKGYIYVCSLADTNGILMLDKNGDFKNYYGTNKVALTLWQTITRALWSREDRLGTAVTLPYTFSNVFYSDGYVYATTIGAAHSQLRKINPGGSDVLYGGVDFSDKALDSTQQFVDVTVDADQNMYIMDNTFGRIYEYDEWGRNLFVFGSVGEGKGQFSNPVSLEVDGDGSLYVLNKNNGTINVYEPTAFATLVHTANKNYSNGIYTEEIANNNGILNPEFNNAKTQWETVRTEDNFYRLALQSIGQIQWRLGNYQEAYDEFVKAEDASWASSAFEELRAQFLSEHFSLIATIIVVALVGLLIFQAVMKRYRKKHPADPNSKNIFAVIGRFFKKMVNIIAHPVDGFEDIRYENKGSYVDAIIIMIIYIVTHCLSILCTSFIYRNGQSLEWVKWGEEILWCILPWIVVAVVNYGVTSIMYGEGRMRDVIIGGAYCHVPFILVQLPLAIISQVLTLQEQSLYSLVNTASYALVIILVFFCIKGVHGFNPLKAFIVFIITILGVIAVAVLYMIVYGLASQIVEFVVQFAKELSYLA